MRDEETTEHNDLHERDVSRQDDNLFPSDAKLSSLSATCLFASVSSFVSNSDC